MKQSHILSKKFFFHAYRALAAVFSFVVMCGLGFALYLSAELPDGTIWQREMIFPSATTG